MEGVGGLCPVVGGAQRWLSQEAQGGMEEPRSRQSQPGEPRPGASLRLGRRMLAIVALALTPALGLLLFASFELRETAVRDAKAEALRLATAAGENQARIIEGSRQLLAVLATLPEIRQGDDAACHRVLADLLRHNPSYLNFGVTDTAGNVVCSSLPVTAPVNSAGRSWFRRAWATRAFSVGDYQIGRITGKPSLNVAQPILLPDGRVRGVIVAAINLGAFAGLAARLDLPPGASLHVVDGIGVVLARYPEPGSWVGRSTAREPSTAQMLALRCGVFEAVGFDGVPRFYGCAPLPSGGGYVAVGIPRAATLDAANRVLAWGLIGLGLVAITGLLLAWLLGRGLIVLPVASTLESAAGEFRRLQADADRETQLLRAVVDQTADPALAADPTGRLRYWNAALRDATGYGRDDLTGFHVWDVVPDLDRDQWSAMWRRVRAVGSVRMLGSGARRDGGRFPVELRLTHVAFEGEEYFCAVLRDVTGLRTAQSALAENALLSEAVEQAPVAVVVTDAEGRIEHVNAAFTRITGYSLVEALGATPRILKSGAQDPEFYCAMWTTALSGTPWRGEVVNRRKDGTLYTQELVIAPVRDAEGRLAHLVGIGHDVTSARRLREALELTQVAMDRSTDMVVWVDARGRFTYANESALRSLGYTRYELLARSLWDVSRTVREEGWAEAWETGRAAGSWKMEDEVCRKDGSTIPVEVAVTHIGSGTREIEFAILRDLTTRRRGEEALRESERLLRESQRLVRLGSYRFDVASGTWTSSTILDEILGIIDPPARRDTAYWLSIVHPGDRAAMARYFAEEVLGRRRSFDREYRIVRLGDGEERWVHGLGELVSDREGRLVEMIGTIQDIDDQKKSEHALRHSEERYRAVVESARDCIFSLAPDGEIESLNPAFEVTTGWSREEWLGRPFAPIVHPDDLGPAQDMLRRAAAGDRQPPMECRALTKSGAYVLWEVSVASSAAGGPGHILGIARDITERRRLEDQLQQAQKMEAVGALAGGVAHDFNNLLTAIMGYTQLLAVRARPGDPALRDVEEILKASTRAAMLTRQLLTFSRRELVQPRVLDLNALVADLGKMLRRLIGEDIEMVLAASARRPAVKADPGQLEQVILNLAVNARDAVPQGGRITIETSNVEIDADYAGETPGLRTGPYVLLAVSDTGTGMDETTKARIFEPFFTTKEAGKGTGLGLFTVYGIVHQCGGAIRVHSDVGFGATFKIYLPCAEGPVDPARPADSLEDAPHGVETVLIVEDQDAVAAVMRGALESCGYRVLEARHALDAVRMFEERREPIHLLVTDVVLPMIAGPELVQKLRAPRPDLRVLYVSGYTERALSLHLGQGGPATGFLQKPFTPGTLVRKVRDLLDLDLIPSA